MSVTYAQFISLACQQALAGMNPLTAPILDIELTAETLVPTVFQNVAMAYAADPDKRSLLRRSHSLTLVNGVADLPDEALSAGKAGATISDPTDITVAQNASMVWYWNDFVAPRSGLLAQIPIWLINDDDALLNQFFYLEPNETYDPSSGFSGTLDIYIASVPTIPATAATTLSAPSEFVSDAIAALAAALSSRVKAVA